MPSENVLSLRADMSAVTEFILALEDLVSTMSPERSRQMAGYMAEYKGELVVSESITDAEGNACMKFIPAPELKAFVADLSNV